MAVRRRTEGPSKVTRHRPSTTPEGRESELIALAIDAAEKRIRDGSASAQEIVHYLKLGSSRERLEQERLAHENQLLQVKREAIESQKRVEELYTEALDAMRIYSSGSLTDPGDEFDG